MFGLKKPMLALLALGGFAAGTQLYAANLPVNYSETYAYTLVATTNWNGSPPGANDWSCKPSAEHPYPVILVPPTFASAAVNWNAVSPYLANQGYCVFSLNYGQAPFIPPGLTGVSDPDLSVGQIASFVAQVLSATGASKVDMVAHSQGGMDTRQFIEYNGGANQVHTLVLFSSPASLASGVSLGSLATVLLDGIPPFIQGIITGISTATLPIFGAWLNASYWEKLNGIDNGFPPPVHYSAISSLADEGVTSSLINYTPPAASNTSPIQYVQDYCPIAFPGHYELPFSHTAVALIGNALDPEHAVRPPCVFEPFSI